MVESKDKTEVVISLDIEADGPAPGSHSCLMLGFAVLKSRADPSTDKNWLLEKKRWCLASQPDCVPDKKCLEEFWLKEENKKLRAYIREHEQDITIVMNEFARWYAELQKKYSIKEWVARPASYDHQWINHLYYKYCTLKDKPIIPFQTTCISSIKSACVKVLGYKFEFPKSKEIPHTHYADDDAVEQGCMYLEIMRQLEKLYLVPRISK